MKPARRRLLAAPLALAAAGAVRAADAPAIAPPVSSTAVGRKVLRYAFRVAETSFDPAAINDLYSRIITGHIFEGLVGYDPLARPALLRPLTIVDLPTIEDDWKRWTFRIQPGIFFADDPVFGGKPRELVAQDYVFAIQRFADPAVRSPNWGSVDQYGIVGLAAKRDKVVRDKTPFDYDAPLPGLRALDRYTLRIELAEARPRLLEMLAQGDLFGAMAREVAEHYGPDIGAHPVGTGPFRLAQWRRASLVALDRNPTYRDRRYDAQPTPGDTEGQALLARFKGRRLPMVDRVEISIIEQDQPRWLAFLNGDANFMERLPYAFADLVLPNGRLAPAYVRQRLQVYRLVAPDETMMMFNLTDPVVGGLDPAHVALRRAIGLGIDGRRLGRLVFHGQLAPAQSQVVPGTTGYDPSFTSEMSVYDPGRAKALLDTWGWTDRDGDGWREQPDGAPLTIVVANQSDPTSHLQGELLALDLKALGLRADFQIRQWPENLKAAYAGKLMFWNVASSATAPDGQQALERLYGPSGGGTNIARFALPEFDAIYRRMLVMPDGPERLALFRELKRLGVAYMPYKVLGHRTIIDMAWPQVVGFRRPLFWQDWWQYVDME